MKVANAEQMQELDRKAIETYRIPGIVLMENAGRGAAEVISKGRAAMKKGINHGKRAHFSVGPYFLKTVFSFAQSTPIRKVGPQSNGTKAQKAMSAVPPKEISLATFF